MGLSGLNILPYVHTCVAFIHKKCCGSCCSAAMDMPATCMALGVAFCKMVVQHLGYSGAAAPHQVCVPSPHAEYNMGTSHVRSFHLPHMCVAPNVLNFGGEIPSELKDCRSV